ncbi:hypothetical protein DV736_g1336, partial [Chaetothyriales sp. CBS 134916]
MWSLSPVALFLGMLLSRRVLVMAQEDVDPCLLNCVANVNGTQCAQGQWSCLCGDQIYIERLNNCTYAECNKTDQDTAFGAIAQICNVFGYTITYGPEATAATPSSTPIFSTQGVVFTTASLPPDSASAAASTGPNSGDLTIETSPTSTSSTAALRSSSSSGSAAAAKSAGGASRISSGLSLAVLAGVNVIFHH